MKRITRTFLIIAHILAPCAVFAAPAGVANARIVRSLDLSKNRIRTADYSLKKAHGAVIARFEEAAK